MSLKVSETFFLQGLTHEPGVYQMLDSAGVVLYVGKAKDLKNRLSSYFSTAEKDIKTKTLLENTENITVTVTPDENTALLLECNLIKKLSPRYNVIFRDDKSYPFICLTKHVFPQIKMHRGRKKITNMDMFGPYPDVSAVRETISLIEKIFRIRNCSNSFFAARTRPCLQYQINRCSAPCVGLVSEGVYQNNIQMAKLFLQGKSAHIIETLKNAMSDSASTLDYERAATCRDQISRLRGMSSKQYINGPQVNTDILGITKSSGVVCIQMLVLRNGRIIGSRAFFPKTTGSESDAEVISTFIVQRYLDDNFSAQEIPSLFVIGMDLLELNGLISALENRSGHVVNISKAQRGLRKKWLEMAEKSSKEAISAKLFSKMHLGKRFIELAKVLDLPAAFTRIEAIDISHMMGESTVGSCVVFSDSGPLKNLYRRFNITGITPGDDVAAISQLLDRRFTNFDKKPTTTLPDILLIDGGVAQSRVARDILQQKSLGFILVVGVSKGVARKPGFEVLHLPGDKTLQLPTDSDALHLIQLARDEAHRFAITAHRSRRDKKRIRSVLETIPGVGSRRRRELLQHFGGFQELSRASLEGIMEVPSISRVLAVRIYEALHSSSS